MRAATWLKQRWQGFKPKLAPAENYLGKLVVTNNFEKKYLAASAVILLASTLLWGILGAVIAHSNADQLINPLLLQNSATFHGALLPSQHTFLLKWPLFGLIKLLHFSGGAFLAVTLGAVLATVAALAWLLSRIERRPMVLGTIYIALASCLLLVPAQPYAGGLLPVNMAMLATRNLEYVVYIAAIYTLLRSQKLRSWPFWLSAGLLAILIASDKLFLTMTLGGSVIALVIYSLSGAWNMVSASVRWMVSGIIGVLGAGGLLYWAGRHAVHIAGGGVVGPYKTIHSLHDAVLGGLYGLLGLFTNLGANPAYSATTIKSIPSQAAHNLLSLSGPAYLINILLAVCAAYGAFVLVRMSLREPKKKILALDEASKLSIFLLASTIAALIVFVASNHYWAVDGRYLGIVIFAAAVAGTSFMRQQDGSAKKLAGIGLVVMAVMILAVPGVVRNFNNDRRALAGTDDRNHLIVQVLAHHKVDALVGDYWRTVPVKAATGGSLDIVPLTDCTTPRGDLDSSHWNLDLKKHSFAYLLSLDASLTNFPRCTLDNTIKTYGRPNTSVVIAGSQTNPQELLLFYDSGSRKSAPKIVLPTPSTVLPIPLSELPYTSCPEGTTIMNIVAHQDDDLLFINPDTQNALKEGHCIRTVYVTAGDGGGGEFYWLSREQGSEAAYSTMLNSHEIWIKRIIQLAPHEFISVSHPRSDYRVSLVFMHLPDGNTTGSGFRRYLYESLAGLESGRVSTINTVDGQSEYTSSEVVDALKALMKVYQPVEIRTQANYPSKQYPDHSDHMAVGRYVKRAYTKYESEQFEDSVAIPLSYYIGYPIHAMPENVSGSELTAKEAAWFAYAQHDGGACISEQQCNTSSVYGVYLKRQYRSPY